MSLNPDIPRLFSTGSRLPYPPFPVLSPLRSVESFTLESDQENVPPDPEHNSDGTIKDSDTKYPKYFTYRRIKADIFWLHGVLWYEAPYANIPDVSSYLVYKVLPHTTPKRFSPIFITTLRMTVQEFDKKTILGGIKAVDDSVLWDIWCKAEQKRTSLVFKRIIKIPGTWRIIGESLLNQFKLVIIYNTVGRRCFYQFG